MKSQYVVIFFSVVSWPNQIWLYVWDDEAKDQNNEQMHISSSR